MTMKRSNSQHHRTGCHRGSILLEAVVGAMILGVAMALLVPGLTSVRRQRQAVRFETMAMVELNNIAEFLPDLNVTTNDGSDDSGTLEFSETPQLSEWFTARYSGAELDVELLPPAPNDPVESLYGVRLTIQRPASDFLPNQKVSTVVWKVSQEIAP
jgi:hypothetical protein